MTHAFAASLEKSEDVSTRPWWEPFYRQAFPSFACMAYVGDCPTQRDGVDRVITTATGHIYRVEEKVRDKDYDDFFLEFWSVEERKERGWVAKDLGADFLAYVFEPSLRFYLLPFPLLRRAWAKNGPGWVKTYGARRVPNRGYTTVGVPVPIAVVLSAISEASIFAPADPAKSRVLEVIDGWEF